MDLEKRTGSKANPKPKVENGLQRRAYFARIALSTRHPRDDYLRQMKQLFDEISQRFPEIRERIEIDADLSYMLMNTLAEWLGSLPPHELTPDIVNRVMAFTQWCRKQPRGEDASDDLLTIWTVGFYEKLFCSETSRSLIPKLMSRKELTLNAEYLKHWVGEDDYRKALKLYDGKRRKRR